MVGVAVILNATFTIEDEHALSVGALDGVVV